MASDKKGGSGGASGTNGRGKQPARSIRDMSSEERDSVFRKVTAQEEEMYLTREHYSQGLTQLQADAIADYKYEGYQTVNDQLRNGRDRGADTLINALNSVDYRLGEDLTLYRGIVTNRGGQRAKMYTEWLAAHRAGELVGTEFLDKGFGSATTNQGKSFYGSLQLKIRAPKGTRALVPDYDTEFGRKEAEIILGSNTKYRIIDSQLVGPAGEKILAVELEII